MKKLFIFLAMISFNFNSFGQSVFTEAAQAQVLENIERQIRTHEIAIDSKKYHISLLKDILGDAKRDAYIATGAGAIATFGVGSLAGGITGYGLFTLSEVAAFAMSAEQFAITMTALSVSGLIPASIAVGIREYNTTTDLSDNEKLQLMALLDYGKLARAHKDVEQEFSKEHNEGELWAKVKDSLTLGWSDVGFVEDSIKLAKKHIELHQTQIKLLKTIQDNQ